MDRQRAIYRPPWRIELTQRAGVPRLLADAALTRTIESALEAAGAPRPATIGLILTADEEIAALNESQMGHEGATDVLSFPLLPPDAFPGHPGKAEAAGGRGAGPGTAFRGPPGRRTHLGELVVSVERAIAQATEGRGGHTSEVAWSPEEELRLLITHGVLHVCGWDHAEPEERDTMRRLELQLLAQPRPADPKDHVLSRFSEAERADLARALRRVGRWSCGTANLAIAPPSTNCYVGSGRRTPNGARWHPSIRTVEEGAWVQDAGSPRCWPRYRC